MTTRVHRTGEWLYQGLWGILTRWFRVPALPPTLPVAAGETANAFQPSAGFLRYMIFQYWLGVVVVSVGLLILGVSITVVEPMAGIAYWLIALAAGVAIALVAYTAIHLRYDTTWYVLTGRSMRIRRGIWVIHETTITYENVQNVSVHQGPLQRIFGIADVVVQTAGGGGGAQPQQPGGVAGGAHSGLIEGITDAVQVRDLLVSRMRLSRTAGLGDEHHEHDGGSWTPQQLAMLREVRDVALALAGTKNKKQEVTEETES
jgi:membrane protein YdbS with pleckstrin-like domain